MSAPLGAPPGLGDRLRGMMVAAASVPALTGRGGGMCGLPCLLETARAIARAPLSLPTLGRRKPAEAALAAALRGACLPGDPWLRYRSALAEAGCQGSAPSPPRLMAAAMAVLASRAGATAAAMVGDHAWALDPVGVGADLGLDPASPRWGARLPAQSIALSEARERLASLCMQLLHALRARTGVAALASDLRTGLGVRHGEDGDVPLALIAWARAVDDPARTLVSLDGFCLEPAAATLAAMLAGASAGIDGLSPAILDAAVKVAGGLRRFERVADELAEAVASGLPCTEQPLIRRLLAGTTA